MSGAINAHIHKAMVHFISEHESKAKIPQN